MVEEINNECQDYGAIAIVVLVSNREFQIFLLKIELFTFYCDDGNIFFSKI